MKGTSLIVSIFFLSVVILTGCNASTETKANEVILNNDEILSIIKIGMTESELQESIKFNHAEVIGAKDNSKVWRYDIGIKDSYDYQETMDFADLEGIKKGNVSKQLFVTWSKEGEVDRYSLLYVGDDGKVHELRKNNNGEEVDSIV